VRAVVGAEGHSEQAGRADATGKHARQTGAFADHAAVVDTAADHARAVHAMSLDTGRRVDRNAGALWQHPSRAEHTSACVGITPDTDPNRISVDVFGLLPTGCRIESFYLRHDAPPWIDTPPERSRDKLSGPA